MDDLLSPVQFYWSDNSCQEPNCDESGIPLDGVRYCVEHADKHNYCVLCGKIRAGKSQRKSLDTYGVCIYCHREMNK